MSGSAFPFLPRWRFAVLLSCHVAAGLLWVSLAFDPGASLWRAVDEAAFFAMNGILGAGQWMQAAWAYMNVKNYDNINGAIMVLFALWAFWQDRDRSVAGRLSLFVLLALAIIAGVIASKTIFVDIDKLSPSIYFKTGFYDLAQLMPDIRAKTGSPQSFPADHGVVTFLYVGFFWFTTPRRYFWIAFVIGLFNAVPRMVVGAHWLSDTIVGGGVFALIVLSWALATPVLVWIEAMGAWVLRRVGLGRLT